MSYGEQPPADVMFRRLLDQMYLGLEGRIPVLLMGLTLDPEPVGRNMRVVVPAAMYEYVMNPKIRADLIEAFRESMLAFALPDELKNLKEIDLKEPNGT